tara:strand:- start:21792 stop:21953 length:162 start_codon:yes stop_codon:yes gene_type:complete
MGDADNTWKEIKEMLSKDELPDAVVVGKAIEKFEEEKRNDRTKIKSRRGDIFK